MLDIRQHVLDNGLRVVLAPDRTTPVVGVNLWYGVGSRNEPEGRTGFAHIFEHMMFQGSAHVPTNGHFHHIERVGGSANATTWFDRTNYYATVPSHNLDLALWLESDRMGWMLPAMTAEKLENQRQVVMNERRQRYDNQPYGDWDERVQALLFPESHPYHHTVIGSMEDIAAATLDDIHDFFATYYLPNNAVLSVCGDCDPDHALDRIRHYFEGIPSGPAPPRLPGTTEIPLSTGETARSDVHAAGDLTEAEVARAVIGSETRTLRALQRIETRADLLSMYATLFNDARRLNEDLRRLRRVSPDEAREWCGAYLHAGNRVVVRYLPGDGAGNRAAVGTEQGASA